MDRYNFDPDNTSQGRTLHTYTPRSHEDLLRSHLQLDATRNARLQNELQRLADENKKLRRDLKNAQKDLEDKDNEISDLKDKLRDKPKPPREPRTSTQDEQPYDPNKVFEIDGKPVTLEQIINHFSGVIQKHHDLLDRKNRRIQELEDALRNQPMVNSKPTRNAETQTAKPKDDRQDPMNDFAKELALIRKEYEQVENILTDRNNKLEKMIEDMTRKLDQYADEIDRLRKELAAREMQPNDNMKMLIREKEKENEYLKDIINSLKHQTPTTVMMPDSTNEDLENEIKKIIEDKKSAVHKLSNMIVELKKTPSEKETDYPDTTDIERECQAMMADLNNMNDKLINILNKIKQSPQTTTGEPVNKDQLLHNLNQLKKQCEEEIKALKNQIKPGTTDGRVILTGQARVKIDDPDFLKRRPQSPESDVDEPVNIPSNIQFILYPQSGAPVRRQPTREDPYPQPTRTPEVDEPFRPFTYTPEADEPARPFAYTPESSLNSYRPVDFKSVTPPQQSYRYIPETKPKSRLYPELPSEIRSFPSEPRHYHPVPCEACQEDYVPQGVTIPTRDKRGVSPGKPKKKGCCGGKGSETSNVPYSKDPDEEKLVQIHSPKPTKSQHRQPKSKKDDKLSPSRSRTPEGSPKPTKSRHRPSKSPKDDKLPPSRSRTPEDSPKPTKSRHRPSKSKKDDKLPPSRSRTPERSPKPSKSRHRPSKSPKDDKLPPSRSRTPEGSPKRSKSRHRPSKSKKDDKHPPSRSGTPEGSPKPKKKLISKLRPDR